MDNHSLSAQIRSCQGETLLYPHESRLFQFSKPLYQYPTMSQANVVHKLTLAVMDLVAGYEERNSLFIHLFNICSQIQATIAPLVVDDSQSLNSNTENCLRSLAPILRLTYNHLEMWTHRRTHGLISLYNPWLLAHKLKVHKRQLLEQYIMLVASLQVVDRIKGYNFVSPAVSVYSLQEHNQIVRRKTEDHVTFFPNSEAKTFWDRYFKGQVSNMSCLIILHAHVY